MNYLGDFKVGSSVNFNFTTHAAAGGAVAPSSAFESADLVIYKNASATQRASANGVSMTSPCDSIVGLHHVEINLADDTDPGFWAAGNDYFVILSPDETVDSQTVVKEVASFSIENRVVNWAQVVSPGSTVGLSGTTIKTATDVETDTADIQSRIPAALTGDGMMKADTLFVNGTGQSNGDLNLKIDSRASQTSVDNLPTAVWSSATRTLSSFGSLIADIWAYATRTLTSGAAPSAAENAAAVWDEALAGHNTAGSAGAGLSAAQAAGDPWSTAVPGAYASGTAGHKFGNLPSSSAIAAALTGVTNVEFMGSPMQGPRVVLVRGSAYLKSQEMAPYQRIAKAAYPDMGLDTVVGFRMKVYRSDATFEVIVDGVIESFDATYWNLYADLSSADTALLIVGEGVAQFWVELDGIAEHITVSEYKLTVKHGVGVA